MTLRILDLFSGIGGFALAAHQIDGLETVAFAEKDQAASLVLARHFPDIINLGEVENVTAETLKPLGKIDIICGGFPCQGLSVAGKREGLRDERSNLWFEFFRIIALVRPEWVVIENVPGLLSSGPKDENGSTRKGIDMAIVLAGLTARIPIIPHGGWLDSGVMPGQKFAYSVAWRVIDAQYYGLAQRRRRVFIVGRIGKRSPVEILFERDCLPGGSPPSRKAREASSAHSGTGDAVAGTVSAKWSKGTGGPSGDEGQNLIALSVENLTPGETQRRRVYSANGLAPNLSAEEGRGAGVPSVMAFDSRNLVGSEHVTQTLQSKPTGGQSLNFMPTIAITERGVTGGGRNFIHSEELAYTLTNPGGGGRADSRLVARQSGIRRLTPLECERLQGFPDMWTAVDKGRSHRMDDDAIAYMRHHYQRMYGITLLDNGVKRLMSDSARYKMLGNAVAVPVARWIMRRIKEESDGQG